MVIGPHASLLFEDYLEKEQYQYLLGIFIHYCINQYSLQNLIYYILESLLSAEQMIPLPLEYFNPCNCTSFLQSNCPNKVPLMPLYCQLACEKLKTLLWSANLLNNTLQLISFNSFTWQGWEPQEQDRPAAAATNLYKHVVGVIFYRHTGHMGHILYDIQVIGVINSIIKWIELIV